ncbi:MAG: hypothetical protein Q8876_08785 [Bacillota bacterium]|nr:hypothetical protein [Bacillota bacterium]
MKSTKSFFSFLIVLLILLISTSVFSVISIYNSTDVTASQSITSSNTNKTEAIASQPNTSPSNTTDDASNFRTLTSADLEKLGIPKEDYDGISLDALTCCIKGGANSATKENVLEAIRYIKITKPYSIDLFNSKAKMNTAFNSNGSCKEIFLDSPGSDSESDILTYDSIFFDFQNNIAYCNTSGTATDWSGIKVKLTDDISKQAQKKVIDFIKSVNDLTQKDTNYNIKLAIQLNDNKIFAYDSLYSKHTEFFELKTELDNLISKCQVLYDDYNPNLVTRSAPTNAVVPNTTSSTKISSTFKNDLINSIKNNSKLFDIRKASEFTEDIPHFAVNYAVKDGSIYNCVFQINYSGCMAGTISYVWFCKFNYETKKFTYTKQLAQNSRWDYSNLYFATVDSKPYVIIDCWQRWSHTMDKKIFSLTNGEFYGDFELLSGYEFESIDKNLAKQLNLPRTNSPKGGSFLMDYGYGYSWDYDGNYQLSFYDINNDGKADAVFEGIVKIKTDKLGNKSKTASFRLRQVYLYNKSFSAFVYNKEYSFMKLR